MNAPTTLERAFAIARSGACGSVAEIRQQLKRERFDLVDAHLAGPAIARQLRALCDQARAGAAPTAVVPTASAVPMPAAPTPTA